MIVAGTVNIVAGIWTNTSPITASRQLSGLDEPVSFAVLGSGAQIIFAAGLIATGIGLFWRLRIAWTFAVLLLVITIGINITKAHFGGALLLPGGVLLALMILQHHFQHGTVLGNSLMSLVGVFAVLAYGTLGLYLLGHQFDPPITTLVAALYFLVETLSTTGYGDYHPTTTLAQGFLITVWIFGLGVFATAFASIASSALTTHLTRLVTPGGMRRMEKNHVILVGHGLIAGNTANELRQRGISFIQLVEPGQEPPLSDHPVVVGDSSDDKVLHKAGISRARMLIAADDDDGENAFVCLAAKAIKSELKVLVAASSQQSIRRLKLARADIVFAPVQVGTRLLANLVEGDEMPAPFLDLLDQDTP